MSLSLFSETHNHIFPRFLSNREGITPLILSTVFRICSISLVAIFSAVYVFTSSSKYFSFQQSFFIVIFFYLIFILAKLGFLIVGEKYSQRYGFKHSIRLSYIPFVIFIPLVIAGKESLGAMLLSALAWGAHAGLFWWGYHGYFVKSQNAKNYGKVLGTSDFIFSLVSIITPLIGVFLINLFGFTGMYIFSLLMMTLSIYVLGLDNEKLPEQKTSIKKVLGDTLTKPIKYLTLISRGMSFETYNIFWHLHLFLLFGTVEELGFLSSASLLATSFLMIFVGRYNDSHGETRSLFVFPPILSLAWVLRFLAQGYFLVIGANTLASLGGRGTHLSVEEIFYKEAKTNISEILLFREFGLISGALLILLTASMAAIFLFDFRFIFLITSLVCLFPMALAKINKT